MVLYLARGNAIVNSLKRSAYQGRFQIQLIYYPLMSLTEHLDRQDQGPVNHFGHLY